MAVATCALEDSRPMQNLLALLQLVTRRGLTFVVKVGHATVEIVVKVFFTK